VATRVALVLACLIAAVTCAEASISVSPSYIELEVGKGRPSQPITIGNASDQEERYRVHVVHFGFSESGDVQMIPTDAHSLAPWIKCNPREFTLGPKSSRAVRLTVVPPKSLPPGEYWAAVWFEPLTGRTNTPAGNRSGKAAVQVVTNVLVPIFGEVPHVDYRCELKDLMAAKTKGGIAIAARLANTGSGRVRLKGSYEILSGGADAPVAQGLIGEDTVLAGGQRIFKQIVKGTFPQDEYTIRVRYESPSLATVLGGQTSVR
jgi:hypothetical protein